MQQKPSGPEQEGASSKQVSAAGRLGLLLLPRLLLAWPFPGLNPKPTSCYLHADSWARGMSRGLHKDALCRLRTPPIDGREMETWVFPIEQVDGEETHISNVLCAQDDKTSDSNRRDNQRPVCRREPWTCRTWALCGGHGPGLSRRRVQAVHTGRNPRPCSSGRGSQDGE